MRPEHIVAFKQTADRFLCWIGLREPNPLGEKWVLNASCRPKPEKCKAKTADNPAFPLAGLVVDPTARPDAFQRSSLPEAVRKWTTEFAAGGRLPTGYTTVATGAERGLVKLQGKSLYPDYDLMALLRSDASGAKLHTSQAEQARLFGEVGPALNRLLGVELIQHGAEFMWLGGVGARESEWVLWFGPGGRFERHPSSMPRGGH